jgi:hypothetical protein
MNLTRHFAAAGVLLAASGCTMSSSDPVVGGTGNVSVLLTDSPFPFDLVSRADLYVVSVSAGTDSGTTGGACTNAHVIATPNRTYDLLALQRGTTATLANAALPPGDYAAVCMTINVDSSSLTLKDGRVLTGSSSPVIDWSAQGQSERILKANLFKPIAVTDNGGTFVIHFDVGKSFIPLSDVEPPRADSGYAFVPSLEAIDPASTGTVTGEVADGGNGGASLPNASVRLMVGVPSAGAGTWFVAATGTTDAAGNFTLAYVVPSSYWASHGWSYIVEAYAPSTMDRSVARRSPVTVLPGSPTELGALVVEPID